MSDSGTCLADPACIEHALHINEGLSGKDLHGVVEGDLDLGKSNVPFRISPKPFFMDEAMLNEIEALGEHLLRFYQAMNRIYMMSVRGTAPKWVSRLLEQGKSETIIEYERMRRFRSAVPAIIRPDIIPTDEGLIISELDSVPGGFGLLAALSEQYSQLGYDVVGGQNGIANGFWEAITSDAKVDDPFVALVVSDESESYRGEMMWMTDRLKELGKRAETVHPRDITFVDDGLYVRGVTGLNGALASVKTADGQDLVKIDVLYRFFELFDLKNIPQIDLIMYAMRKNLIRLTPPFKSFLEEKLLFALIHHSELEPFWLEHLGRESFDVCRRIFPMTWVMDPAEVPPHASITGLEMGGSPVRSFNQLAKASQKERELVVKPSGFSPDAWGSRGVMIGHDMPADEWAQGIQDALDAFHESPHILQRFHQGSRFQTSYYDFDSGDIKSQASRVRLCPYYFVVGGKTKLGGILATCTSLEKKIIHGMSEAIMMPVALKP